MNYRILKCTHVDKTWYWVQRRIFWVWFAMEGTYSGSFNSLIDARKFLVQCETPVTKEVVWWAPNGEISP